MDRDYEALATQKLHVALPTPRPGGIRKVEFFYIACFAVLLGWHLLDKDVEIDRQVIEEREQEACERVMQNAERHAAILAHILNSGGLVTEGTRRVECRVRKS